ncbi:MupA/Atu3671 family FMN-dependent luciferase-like monooxygenase, partial [Streptantibioticus silvisoli]
LGADSLVLIELADKIQHTYDVDITVVQLFEEIVTTEAITRWIEQERTPPTPPAPTAGVPAPTAGAPTASVPAPTATPTASAPVTPAAGAPVPRPARGFAEATAESRRLSEAYQDVLCNNRRFPERDEAERGSAYPVWVDRSEGPYLWDVDGNRLVDMAMGYGSHLFGHNPDFVVRALREQLDKGLHLGAEVAQTGELAQKIRQLTGVERVNFCVSGTEAVFTAMRLARAYTGRGKIVMLQHAYHGHSDATLYSPKPGERRQRVATPNVLGVSAAGAGDVIVGSVDDPGLPEFIREHGDEIAAVLMEPLQNQFPDRDLRDFAVEMRRVTESVGALLIFDEVLTGFRFAPGGFQELYGVEADLVTYGKTVGAGLPVAVVAGRARVMDLVDGGPWTRDLRVGSDRLTYTAGTYGKHPLSMAAANEVLGELARRGPQFSQRLNERGDRLRERLDAVLGEADAGVRVIGRGSLLRFVRSGAVSFAFLGSEFHAFRRALLAEGVYITEIGLSYLSDAHTDEVLDEVVGAVARAARSAKGRTTAGSTAAAERGQAPQASGSGAGAAVTAPVRQAAPAPAAPVVSAVPSRPAERELAVSLSFFGMQDRAHEGDFYGRVVRLAEAAEAGGLDAVWFPERHFDGFAGFSPNPAVLAALVASRTSRIGLRAGSAVLPLHSAVTVAEDWAMLDVASGGRVGVAVASGWMRRDFVLSQAPYEARRELFEQRISELDRLWSGETLRVESPGGTVADVRLFPRPVQARLPLWQAILGSEQSFHEAGRAGRNILTNLIQQDLGELRAKLARYRAGRQEAGLDPAGGEVTVLVHTAFTPDPDSRAAALRDLEHYMFQTFKSTHRDPASVDEASWSGRMAQAARRLQDGLSLIGTGSEWLTQCRALKEAGATEISCLVDFVREPDRWDATVEALAGLRDAVRRPAPAVRPTAPTENDTAQAAAAAERNTAVQDATAAEPAEPVRATDQPAEPFVETERPAEPVRTVELTRGAVEIWAASKISPDAMAAYTIQRLFEVRGEVDGDRLRSAFLEVLRADASLRLEVLPTGEAGVIADHRGAQQDAFVLYDGVAGDRAAFHDRVARDLAARPLDAEHGPALAMRCQVTADGMLIHLAASHAVMDGTQFSDVLRKVGKAYDGERIDEPAPEAAGDGGEADGDRGYWREAVARLPRTTLERAGTRSVVTGDWRGRRYSRRLPDGWLGAVETRAREQRITAFIETLASTMESLNGLAGRHLLYSFPALRPRSRRYGSRANLLPIWADDSVKDLRAHCKSAVLNGLQHGSLTFTQIFDGGRAGDPARGRVVPDVTFSWDHFDALRLGTSTIRELPTRTEVVRFPIGVTLTVEPGGGVTLSLDLAEAAGVDDGEKWFDALHTALVQEYAEHAPAAPAAGPDRSEAAGLPHEAAVALAGLAVHCRAVARDNGQHTLRLDGRGRMTDLLVSRARATTNAVLRRCEVERITDVRIAVDSEYDLLVAALVCGMLGVADRAVAGGGTGDGSGVTLEIRPSATGAGSSASHVVVGLSAWTYVAPDATLPDAPQDVAGLAHLLGTFAEDHPSDRVAVVARAAVRVADLLGVDRGSATSETATPAPAAAPAGPDGSAVVRAAWRKALGRDGFGDEEDFFELGGDSIAAIRVVAELNSRLGASLPVSLVYFHPTVAELVTELRSQQAASSTADSSPSPTRR